MGYIEESPEDRATRRVLNEVARERRAQDAKWGEQNHDGVTWITILAEEVGEAARAALAAKFGGRDHGGIAVPIAALRDELVQIAAVAVVTIECIDRGVRQAAAPESGGRCTRRVNPRVGVDQAFECGLTLPCAYHDAPKAEEGR